MEAVVVAHGDVGVPAGLVVADPLFEEVGLGPRAPREASVTLRSDEGVRVARRFQLSVPFLLHSVDHRSEQVHRCFVSSRSLTVQKVRHPGSD